MLHINIQLQSAKKFRLLDSRKSPPILRLFLENMEMIQTLLGDLQSKLLPINISDIPNLNATAKNYRLN